MCVALCVDVIVSVFELFESGVVGVECELVEEVVEELVGVADVGGERGGSGEDGCHICGDGGVVGLSVRLLWIGVVGLRLQRKRIYEEAV